MTSASPAPNSAATVTTVPPARTASSRNVLVIDDSKLCRDMVSKALCDQGFAVTTASDGKAGLVELARKTSGLVILDNEMPTMSGLAFLKALRADKRWSTLPVVMLTTSSAKEVIVEALRYRVAGYLLKDHLVMADLVQRVRSVMEQHQTTPLGMAAANSAEPSPKPQPPRASTPAAASVSNLSREAAALASMSVPALQTRDATIAGIVDGESAKSLAGAVKQVIAIAQLPKPSFAELAAIVRQDPIFAARVIRLSTSAAYAGSKARLASVDDAVRIVGVNAVRDLAAATSVFNAFPAERADGLNLLRCWQHALAVAAVMTRIVPKSDSIAPGLAHLVGLCHDLAEIALRQKFPEEYAAAEDFATQGGVPTIALLPAVFGVSYGELTQSFLAHSKFPPQIAECITEHAMRRVGSPIEASNGLLERALAIANQVANGMLLTSTLDSAVSPIAVSDCRNCLIPSSAINSAELRSEAITTASMLAGLPAEQDQASSNPLVARRESALVYIRHPSLAQLDPLEMALKNLAKTETREKFPTVDELASFDGIVVAAPNAQDALHLSASRQSAQMKSPIPILKLSSTTEESQATEAINGDRQHAYPVTLKTLIRFVESMQVRA